MKIIKAWLNKEYATGTGKFDIEENDQGQYRYRKSDDTTWHDWLDKNYSSWDKRFLDFVKKTPPDIDNTEPNEEQINGMDALKRWLNEGD